MIQGNFRCRSVHMTAETIEQYNPSDIDRVARKFEGWANPFAFITFFLAVVSVFQLGFVDPYTIGLIALNLVMDLISVRNGLSTKVATFLAPVFLSKKSEDAEKKIRRSESSSEINVSGDSLFLNVRESPEDGVVMDFDFSLSVISMLSESYDGTEYAIMHLSNDGEDLYLGTNNSEKLLDSGTPTIHTSFWYVDPVYWNNIRKRAQALFPEQTEEEAQEVHETATVSSRG